VSYFRTVLYSKTHALRLPKKSGDDIKLFVRQAQSTGSVNPEDVPFRRQLDFWAFAIVTAVARGMPPLQQPSNKWGRKFADTDIRSVQMSDELCDLLAVIAFAMLGPEHKGIDDPGQIIEVNNQLAGAGCPELLKQLRKPDLRITTLDKALEFASSLRSEPAAHHHVVNPPPLTQS